MNSDSMSPEKKHLIIQVSVTLLLGIIISIYIGLKIGENEKQILVNRVENISKVLHRPPILTLKGDESDLSNPEYQYLKNKMAILKNTNPDSRFVYLMGYKRTFRKLFFFVDSESPGSKDYSPPGQIYEETTEEETKAFLDGESISEGPYTDRWGRWVSALAPIFDPESNVPIAFIGIDVSATRYYKEIAFGSSLPLVVSIFLSVFMIVSYRTRSDLKMAELNNIKMEFSSFMSHEIRGYVTKMKWSLSNLINEEVGKLTAEEMVYISGLLASSNEFGDLIEEFLDISKMEQDSEVHFHKQDHNIIDLIKSAVEDIREQFHKKEITIAYEGNLPDTAFVNCDGNKIARVFLNVINNAIKYSHERGQVRIGYINSNAMHTFCIKDSGIGIPASEQDGIFKKFYRADNARKVHITGTGLGMYFSKLITERHGGKIWFDSIEGNGSTFYISLPKSDPV